MATYDEIMAATTPTDADALIPEIWAAKLYNEWPKKLVMGQFIGGEESGMPIIMKRELSQGPGDIIRFETMSDLSGTGVTGDTARLKGNEETLEFSEITCTPVRWRHAVALKDQTQRKTKYDLWNGAKTVLSRWAAKHVDTSFYTAAGAGANVLFPGTVAASGDLTATDILDLDSISRARARLEANDAPYVGSTQKYVAIIHTYQDYQLSQDTNWHAIRADADIRGKMNPVFQHFLDVNYLGDWDGVSIFTTPQVPVVAGGSGSIDIASALVMGAEAFAFALGNFFDGKLPMEWITDEDDYGDDKGVGVKFSYESKIFRDNALVRIITACVTP
ncbi:N4-gp56 family major capsid protein [Candidatus Pacearchaeota archaeon]|jgi:N4-gp56 family major capsid protein|nr:N4-gp56 family major capsid protein [Candidatus Pacearchaeota archaeon]